MVQGSPDARLSSPILGFYLRLWIPALSYPHIKILNREREGGTQEGKEGVGREGMTVREISVHIQKFKALKQYKLFN